MKKEEMESLIWKYLDNKVSASEKEILLSWMKESNENRQTFLYIYDLWSMKQEQKFDYKKALKKLKFEHSVREMYIYAGSIAASLILIVSSLWFLHTPESSYNIHKFTTSKLVACNNDIILSLGGKNDMRINEKSVDVRYDENGIIVNNYPIVKESSSLYNELLVPVGKKGKLTLCDGSKIWIKSGTRVAYPSKMDEKTRKIYVDGEIYLEVAHNAEKPFIVNTKDINVQVTGTKFDVAAYSKDDATKVALLQGGINVSREGKNNATHKIIPDQLYTLKNNKESIAKVDASLYSAWVEDIYICDNERICDTMKQLSRLYNNEISCDVDISSLHCSGKFDLSKDIKSVLSDLCQILPIQYKIDKSGNIHLFGSVQ